MFLDHKETKLDINNGNISGKSPNIENVDNILLNKSWVNKEVSGDIRKYFAEWNVSTRYQNLQDAAKRVLKGKFITLNAYARKERSQ